MEKEEESELRMIVKYAFLFLGSIVLGSCMFLAGTLTGMYAGGEAKSIVIAFTPVVIFFAGVWTEKYRKHNPL